MKKFLLISCILFSVQTKSQTFYTIGSDAAGDCSCTCMDISSFDYAFDIGQDSIWFRITTNNARSANYGYHIVVNRDNNLINGDSWSGASSGPCMGFMDFDMNHDRMIAVWPAFSFVEQYDGTGGTILHYSVLKQLISPTVTIVGIKLSEVDADMDGIFDVILGLGDEYYVNNDAAPNSGYYTTSPLSVSPSTRNNYEDKIQVFPNPANFEFTISSPKLISSIEVLNFNGQIIYTLELNKKECTIDISNFPCGIYMLKIAGDESNSYQKLIID